MNLLSLIVSSSLFACVALQAQTPAVPPTPPDPSLDHVLVDDMWVPKHVLQTDGHWDGPSWTGGVVPYYFDPGTVSSGEAASMRLAMAEIEAVCGVDFVPWTSSGSALFIRENPASTTVSNSMVGMQPIPQFLNIGSSHWNDRFVMVHELMHALGFKHEHQRPDRDLYVNIRWSSIHPFLCGGGGCSGNFALFNGQLVGPYDFDSVMHYRGTAFGIGGATTIECKPGFTQYQNTMGHSSYLSPGDTQGLRARYGAPSTAYILSVTPTTIVAGTGDVNIGILGGAFIKGSFDPNRGVQGSRVQFYSNGVWTDADETIVFTPNVIRGRLLVHANFPTGPLQIRVWNDSYAGGPTAAATVNVAPPPCSSANENSGTALVGIQDIDGDGRDEIIESRPGFGSGRGQVTCRSGADGQVLWYYTGTTGNAFVGTALARIGDIDNDGIDDIASGAPGSGNGTVHILSGRTGMSLRTILGSTLGSGPGFGSSVAAAGDLDLNGTPDLVVGSPGFNSSRGRIDLISGSSGNAFFGISGLQVGEMFGSAVSGGVDLTGDGRPEVVVGAPFYDGSNGTNCGRIAIYEAAFGTLLVNAFGDGPADLFGTSVAIAPSTTGSKVGCVAAGAPELASHSAPAGAGYVRLYRYLNGQVTGLNTLATWPGLSTGSKFGYQLVSAGDVDDDGGTDFLIAAPGSLSHAARVELRSGRTGELLWRTTDPASSDLFGAALGTAGGLGTGIVSALIGAPNADGQCTNSGKWFARHFRVRPAPDKLMITEVVSEYSPSQAGAIELTNFSSSVIDLSDWNVRWRDLVGGGSSGQASSLAGILIRPRESIVLRTMLGASPSETPPTVQTLTVMTGGASYTSDFVASLIAPNGYVIDEVRSENPDGTYNEGSYGGKFEGAVHNHHSGSFLGTTRIERIWGLDSNRASDWTVGSVSSMGLENRSAGSRDLRSQSHEVERMKINEISRGAATYIEIVNRGTGPAFMQGYSLRYSAVHGGAIQEVLPFIDGAIASPGEYMVIGSTAQAPAELPNNTAYRRISGLALGSNEFTIGLYDASGRLLDLVRTTRANSELVHNDPRLPSHPNDFRGAARVTDMNQSIGRNSAGDDTNTGDDWRHFAVRTMGSNNLLPSWSPNPAEGLDVRLSSRPGVALSMILEAGPERAGQLWSFAASVGHWYGQGPVFGLGPDAINNWLLLSNTPPFAGVLDTYGDARLDLGFLPPGLALDVVFVLQEPLTGQIVMLTQVMMYDS